MVENLSSAATVGPGILIAARAVKQIEHRIALLSGVSRRSVHRHAALFHSLDGRRIPHLFEVSASCHTVGIGIIRAGEAIDNEIVVIAVDIAHQRRHQRIGNETIIHTNAKGVEFRIEAWSGIGPHAVGALHRHLLAAYDGSHLGVGNTFQRGKATLNLNVGIGRSIDSDGGTAIGTHRQMHLTLRSIGTEPRHHHHRG